MCLSCVVGSLWEQEQLCHAQVRENPRKNTASSRPMPMSSELTSGGLLLPCFSALFSCSLSPSLWQDGTEEESLLTIEIEDGDFAEGDVRARECVDVWLCMR